MTEQINNLLQTGESVDPIAKPEHGSQEWAYGSAFGEIQNSTNAEGNSVVIDILPEGATEPVVIVSDITLTVRPLEGTGRAVIWNTEQTDDEVRVVDLAEDNPLTLQQNDAYYYLNTGDGRLLLRDDSVPAFQDGDEVMLNAEPQEGQIDGRTIELPVDFLRGYKLAKKSSEIKERLEFGTGSFVGSALNDPTFHELPIREQARVIGWAVGCPVVNELTDPHNTEPGRGPEAMLHRYGEVGYWFGHIARSVKEVNPDLYLQLMTPVQRRADEPIGKYEPESVPGSYNSEIPPTETLVGYSLPRIFIKQLGEGKERGEAQTRLLRGLAVLDTAIHEAQTPEELLALVAEGLSKEDVEPVSALSSVLPTGWYREHNADRMLGAFKNTLAEKAPSLWGVYEKLSDEEKKQQNIL
jgi:hypothetical protein